MFLWFAAAAVLQSSLSREVNTLADGHAEVSGIVTDIHGSLVTNADVEFQGKGGRHSSQTGSEGEYSIQLPSGVYTMEIRHYGFCRVRRGGFLLEAGSVVHFDTQLHVCPSDSPTSRYFYEDLDQVPSSPVRPLILFGDKVPDGDSSWRYTGPVLVGIGTNRVFFTYNLLTITADSLVYDPKGQTVVASGHVLFQDGESTRKGSQVEVTLNGLHPLGRLTQ